MKQIALLILALGLVVTACGDDGASTDPASIDSCESLADASIDLVQDVITELEAMSPSDVGALTQGEVFPAFTAFEERGVTLGDLGQELGCDNIDQLVAERADQLEADPANGFTRLIVEGTAEGQDVFARLFRE